ncbi:hypothetical protein [Hymenobacter sp. AT01-02]|uniref:hypothetical protein n=1 Tax=Hymenobacter sp. AT01-02 TaxID=1571877 RepID=UPI0005F0F72F|nr:hypothetical protein [Hymenobacter sp. AT01-02]
MVKFLLLPAAATLLLLTTNMTQGGLVPLERTNETYVLPAKVGKMQAEFTLKANAADQITGTYRYLKRPGVVYKITGSRDKNANLYLKEYTGDKLTARCDLKMEDNCYVGRMYNTLDGKAFKMSICNVMAEYEHDHYSL